MAAKLKLSEPLWLQRRLGKRFARLRLKDRKKSCFAADALKRKKRGRSGILTGDGKADA